MRALQSTTGIPTAPFPNRPSSVRHGVVLVTTLTAVMLYLDRVCMAKIVDADSFREQLGLDQHQTGWVLSAFFLAYALAQVPSGWFSDRFGARRVLSFYVFLWSAFTVATGLAVGFFTILAARLGCGIAQAGAYPTSGGLLSRWVPLQQRGRASSIVAFGGRVGGAVAPFLTAALIVFFNDWRLPLLTYGLAGLAVAALFWFAFRDWPREHPRCNEAERELIARGRPDGATAASRSVGRAPLEQLITSRSMWLMCLSQWGTNVGWAFLVTWLPTYLKDTKGVGEVDRGTMTTIALTVGMVGMLSGGVVTDVAARHLGVRWGRSLPIAISRFAAMAAYLACLTIDSPWSMTGAFAAVAFFTDLGAGASWAFMQDVGGRHVGSILGWANMWGNLGATVIGGIIPWVLAQWDANGDWHEVFLVCAAGFLVSGVAALGIDASIPIAPDDDEQQQAA